VLAYHGTNRDVVESIKSEGFRKGTYFAVKKENAVAFGGPCVFTVEFSDDPAKWHNLEGDDEFWQFWVREVIPPEQIREYEELV